jgi:hypothetical protein
MHDEIESPAHYQFGQMEAWDIIELAIEGIADPVTAYHVASALKYLLRASRKGGDTDIAKASAHLKRETARHVTSSPDYGPANVAFRHGDSVDARLDVARLRSHGIGDVPARGTKAPESRWAYTRFPDGSSHLYPVSAAELAHADGTIEYGNPVTPGVQL